MDEAKSTYSSCQSLIEGWLVLLGGVLLVGRHQAGGFVEDVLDAVRRGGQPGTGAGRAAGRRRLALRHGGEGGERAAVRRPAAVPQVEQHRTVQVVAQLVLATQIHEPLRVGAFSAVASLCMRAIEPMQQLCAESKCAQLGVSLARYLLIRGCDCGGVSAPTEHWSPTESLMPWPRQ
jgi:hypothetical protein